MVLGVMLNIVSNQHPILQVNLKIAKTRLLFHKTQDDFLLDAT